jgi:alginate O-acetyltransferase complex protein AlgI
MLFTTVPFVLLFLPLTLLGFFALGRHSQRAAAAWLFFASLSFYGFWMPEFTLLLLGSIAMNFVVGLRIAKGHSPGAGPSVLSPKVWLVLGVTLNLLVLAYFKYANFFLNNLNAVMGSDWQLAHVVLPIGISFYSFTQIAFLADTYQRKVSEFNPVHYGLFVTYFPHLIAGPVLHHGQMMPQFANPAIYRWNSAHVATGLAIFALGLFKKVVLADGISPYADAIFKPVDGGALPTTPEAWLGAVAYTLQLYFDFSGYSDMAIGLSWMFNVKLPFNFNSPYKATSISDFWRRWHISLSNFLRDYLYIALGGNRRGAVRRYVNLGTTMLLGGLWHGASWSFVVWGGLHGAALMVNHGFRAALAAWLGTSFLARWDASRVVQIGGWGLTLLCVVVAWVFFRAETLGGALRILHAMAGQEKMALSALDTGVQPLLWNAGLQLPVGWACCAVLAAMAVLAPNSNAIGEWLMQRAKTSSGGTAWLCGAGLCTVAFLIVLNTTRESVSAFIYFNF